MVNNPLELLKRIGLSLYTNSGKKYIPKTIITNDDELACIPMGLDIIQNTHITLNDLRTKYKFSERITSGIDALIQGPKQSNTSFVAQITANPDAKIVSKAKLRPIGNKK
jgi:hypothetical protein